jgi:hypothetical protein
MLRLLLCAVLVAVGWYAHVEYLALRGQVHARVTVTVDPPEASAPKATRPTSQATKPQTTAVPGQARCALNNGVLDTCAGNGYVTPGITYYPPPL